jgi:WD40 repeat protein
MALTKWALALALVAAVGLAAAGAGLFALPKAPPPQPPAPRPAPAKAPAAPEPRKDREGNPLPREAVARVGSTRLRHGQWIYHLGYSPDGSILASSGGSRLRLWDARTGKLLRHIPIQTPRIPDGLFTGDGKAVIALDGQTCRWFDARTGKEIRRCAIKFPKTESLAWFTPRGEAIAVMDQGKEVILYDLPSGKVRFRWATERSWFRELAFSPDGKTLAAVEREGKPPFKHTRIKLFNTSTGQRVGDIDPGGTFRGLTFAPDGKKLLAHDFGTGFRVWKAPAGEELYRLEAPVNAILTAAFSPDGAAVVVGSQGLDAVLIDLATGKDLRRFRTYSSSYPLAFTPDGKTLAVGTGGGEISQWELATGKLLPASASPLVAFIRLQFSADGQLLWGLAATFTATDWKTGEERRRLGVPHAGPVWHLVLSPDRSRAAGLDREWRYVVWDAASGKVVCTLGPDNRAWSSLTFSPDSKRVYTGERDGPVRAWDAVEGRELPAFDHQKRRVHTLVVTPDGRWLAAADHPQDQRSRPDVTIWDLASGREAHRLLPKPDGSFTYDLAFSPDGTLLAAVGGRRGQQDSGFLTIWDVRTGKARLSRMGLQDLVRCAVFSRDGWMLATGGPGPAAGVWEIATGQQRCAFGHEGEVHSVAFSPDGKLLAASSPDAPVFLWDVTGTQDRRPSPTPFSAGEQERLWDTLASPDAAVGFRAMRQLLARPGPAVALLRGRLKPVPAVGAATIRQLVRDLDDDRGAVRRRAAGELEKVADQAEPLLRKALAEGPSAEVRRQIERLLDDLDRGRPERLRPLRAVEVLEHLGTPEARQLLEALAQGAPEARLTREAKASLERLARRPVPAP